MKFTIILAIVAVCCSFADAYVPSFLSVMPREAHLTKRHRQKMRQLGARSLPPAGQPPQGAPPGGQASDPAAVAPKELQANLAPPPPGAADNSGQPPQGAQSAPGGADYASQPPQGGAPPAGQAPADPAAGAPKEGAPHEIQVPNDPAAGASKELKADAAPQGGEPPASQAPEGAPGPGNVGHPPQGSTPEGRLSSGGADKQAPPPGDQAPADAATGSPKELKAVPPATSTASSTPGFIVPSNMKIGKMSQVWTVNYTFKDDEAEKSRKMKAMVKKMVKDMLTKQTGDGVPSAAAGVEPPAQAPQQ